ncbi:MAG TPA: flagellar basal-body MS-ring/collar protein FliF [Gaiellaceae bacterium]|nr:flagellar basal-body MS-ring/collar protein FliF [Gaiellaceae bacterium]
MREAWAGLELRSQVTLIGGLIAVLGTLYFIYGLASKQSYSTLATGLDPSQTGQWEQTLAASGISYKVLTGGTGLEVPAGELSQARIALAEKGVLSNNSSTTFSAFNKTSLGATDFQQQVQYQQALQSEIAQTIEQIQGVNSANVELVIPDDTLFSTQSSKATAAVLVNDGATLDAQTIQGIAHVVASSVKGLNAQNVTITDQTGTLLWPNASSGGVVNAESKLQANDLYSSQLSAEVNAMLASTLGPNKALAHVQADLNADQTTVEKVSYGAKGVPLSTQTQSEALQSKGGGAVLPAGTASNAASNAASTTTGNGTSNYKNSTSTSTFGVAKTVEHSVVAPGAVNKLDVALIVDSSVPAAQVASLQKSVASLVGLNTKRGDTMAVSQIPFAKTPVTTTKPASPIAALGDPISLAKDALIGLAALLFLFFMRRSLKRREGEDSVPTPTWLRELERGMTVAELEAAPSSLELPAPKQVDKIQEQLEEIAESQPQALANQVAQWMTE